MDQRSKIIAATEALARLMEGLNAMGLMTLGLMQARDPYADGLNVLYIYLQETASETKELLAAAMPDR